eukprot:g1736.t1
MKRQALSKIWHNMVAARVPLFGPLKAACRLIYEAPGNSSGWRSLFNVIVLATSQVVAYLGSLNVSNDLKACLLAGLVVGVGLIIFLTYFPGEPFDYDTSLSDAEIKMALREHSAHSAGALEAKGSPEGRVDDEAKAAGGTDAGTDILLRSASQAKAQRGGDLRRRRNKAGGGAEGGAGGGGVTAAAAPPGGADAGGGDDVDSQGKSKAIAPMQARSSGGATTLEERQAIHKEQKRAQIRERIEALEAVQHMADNMKRDEHMRKMLGIGSDEQLDKAIAKTKVDLLRGRRADSISSSSRSFDTMFYLLMFGLIFYFANRDYGFNVFHWLASVFPKEAAVIRSAMEDG